MAVYKKEQASKEREIKKAKLEEERKKKEESDMEKKKWTDLQKQTKEAIANKDEEEGDPEDFW
jgi:hypothetical protein